MTAVPPPYFTPGLRDAGALGVIATGTTALRSLPDRFADTYNLKDFGAIGDGVADDSVAVTAAFAKVVATNGELYIPPGTYRFQTQIVMVNPNIKVRGAGIFSSQLRWFGAAGVAILTTGGGNLELESWWLNAYTGVGNYFRAGDIGLRTSSVLMCHNMYFQGFENLIDWTGGFYHKFFNSRFEMAAVALSNWTANNDSFVGCKVLRVNDFIQASSGQGPVTFTHGSCESWCGILFRGAAGDRVKFVIAFNYFENVPTTAAGNGLATPFYTAGEIVSSFYVLTLIGNEIITAGLLRIADNSGIAISPIINSIGNHIVYTPGAGQSWMDRAFNVVTFGHGLFSDYLDNTLAVTGAPSNTFVYTVGFTAPVVVGAAVAATPATNAGPFGYTTAAQADAIVTNLNQIRAALIQAGINV